MQNFDPFEIINTCYLSMTTCNMQADVPKLIQDIADEIDKGYDINTLDSYGGTMLIDAADRGMENACLMLIEKGIDVSIKGQDGRTALHYAAKNGLTNIVDILIEKGLDVNLVCPKGWSPLTMACSYAHNCHLIDFTVRDAGGNVLKDHPKTKKVRDAYKAFSDTIELLLTHGAELEPIMTETGQTPIVFLAENSDNDMLRIMIDAGAKVDHKDKWGLTPLFFACRNGGNVEAEKTIKLLLDGGANINEQDDCGFTPLMEAVMGKHTKAVKLLIKEGADTSIKLTKGYAPYTNHETALDIAKKQKFKEIEKLLK